MQIIIMPMQVEHIERIMAIEKCCFAIPWSKTAFEEEIRNNGHAIYIVAEYDGEITGYAGMWGILDEGHITNIAVHPDYRRMQIGSALVQALRDIARQNNIKQLTLEVRESNRSAQLLYEKFGFKVAGRRKKYYEDNNEDALIMWGGI